MNRALALMLLPMLAAWSGAQPVGNDFESAADLAAVHATAANVALALEPAPAAVRRGQSSLRLTVTDLGGGRETWPALDFTLPRPLDLATVQAIECWVHVPPELARFFFGRYDARFTINGRKPLWSRPALAPGWTKLRWELRNLHAFPETRSLRLQLGPIMPGFGVGRLHVDALDFVPMEPLGEHDASRLAPIAADRAAPWTHRFQAIRRLERDGSVGDLAPLFAATADGAADEGFNPTSDDVQPAYILKPTLGSEAVRSAARAAILAIARRIETAGLPALPAVLEKALADGDGRVRLAAAQTVAALDADRLPGWADPVLRRAMLDELYYVRETALAGLGRLGIDKAQVAGHLGRLLATAAPSSRLAAARALSELGSPARPALPQILAILRGTAADSQLRAWCLRAAWWTDERVLTPDDWALALELKPGDVHRHLLNRAMDRLTKAGAAAVPALTRVLTSFNPEARARAAGLLRDAGAAGRAALATAERDAKWYVRAAAGRTEPAPVTLSAPVTVRDERDRVSFDNGAITVAFAKNGRDPGPIEARLPGGPNLLDSEWLYRVLSFKDTQAQNIIERVWFQKIRGVPLDKTLSWRLGACSAEQAEMIYRYPVSDAAPLEWEFHYVLRRGDAGFHSFIVVRNVTGRELPNSTVSSSADAIGMFNQLVAPTWGLFDTAVLHDRFKWPATFTAEPDFDGYPDIYQATYRLPNGEVDAKHEGGNHELASPVAGYCGPHGGVWQITPALDYAGGSWPWDQKTGVNHNMFVFSLENRYYLPTAPRLTPGWRKIYGPIFHYLNRGENTEEMWADAKRRATAEVAAWPQTWMSVEGFLERGTVTGRVVRPDRGSPAGAWALLALPDTTLPAGIEFGAWWRDVGRYHYAARVAPDGTFTLPHVQPGDYSLFVWQEGVLGEARRDGLRVAAGSTLDTGTIALTPRRRGRLLWQIGEANRTVTEFRNGGNFHQWENYLRYRDDFPHDVQFEVGRSDPAHDWNYLQPALVPGEAKPTTWAVTFDFDAVQPGRPILTVVAGGRGVNLDLAINGVKIGELRIDEIGLQHIRTVPNGELTVHEHAFDRAALRPGRNTLTLSFARPGGRTEEGAQWVYQNWTNYVAYDLIRLELAP